MKTQEFVQWCDDKATVDRPPPQQQQQGNIPSTVLVMGTNVAASVDDEGLTVAPDDRQFSCIDENNNVGTFLGGGVDNNNNNKSSSETKDLDTASLSAEDSSEGNARLRDPHQAKGEQAVNRGGGGDDTNNEPKNRQERDWKGIARNLGMAAGIGGAVVATGGLALTAAGFGASGIVGGSIAAAVQSSIGNVAAGSTFAALQSAGATGTIAAWTSVGTWSAAGGGAAATWFGWKTNKNASEEKEKNDTKEGNCGDDVPKEDDKEVSKDAAAASYPHYEKFQTGLYRYPDDNRQVTGRIVNVQYLNQTDGVYCYSIKIKGSGNVIQTTSPHSLQPRDNLQPLFDRGQRVLHTQTNRYVTITDIDLCTTKEPHYTVIVDDNGDAWRTVEEHLEF